MDEHLQKPADAGFSFFYLFVSLPAIHLVSGMGMENEFVSVHAHAFVMIQEWK